MAFGKKGTASKIIPDDVFANAPFLQKLQAAGLYDQDGASNLLHRGSTETFQLVPDQVLLELGPWMTSLLRSEMYCEHVAPRNLVQLPGPIAAAILAEGRPVNPPFEYYTTYVRKGVRNLACTATKVTDAKLGTSGMAPLDPASHRWSVARKHCGWDTEFRVVLCGHLAAWMDELAPRVLTGELPLSLAWPKLPLEAAQASAR